MKPIKIRDLIDALEAAAANGMQAVDYIASGNEYWLEFHNRDLRMNLSVPIGDVGGRKAFIEHTTRKNCVDVPLEAK